MVKKRMICAGFFLALFIVITCFVCTGRELGFDTAVAGWIYSIRAPWLTEIVKGITFMADTETIVVLCLIFFIIPMTRMKISIPVAATAIIGTVINNAMKHIFLRPRPDVSLHLIEQGGWSFPSGHSISGFLMYGLLAWLVLRYVRNKKVAAVVAALLTLLWIGIGLSRIYLGVHYPTDVIGAWSVGMIILLGVITVIEKKKSRG